MIPTITFKPLDFSYIPLMYRWFNMPHIQQFYSLRAWTEDEVLIKLKPYINGEKPVTGLIILCDNKPIGYLQYYKVKDYPWPNQILSDEVIRNAAGMDLFIGEPEMVRSGLGQTIISTCLQTIIWPQFKYCLVDPDIHNNAAIKCYQKLGFKVHQTIQTADAINRATQLQLMLLQHREKS